MGLFEKKFKCDACGITFRSENDLMKHAGVHMTTTQSQKETQDHSCGCGCS